MSQPDEGVHRFTIEFIFDADRSRFGKNMYAYLLVYDEILEDNIVICPTYTPPDLNKPGEGIVNYRVVSCEPIPIEPQQ